jgi:hypothetical protein
VAIGDVTVGHALEAMTGVSSGTSEGEARRAFTGQDGRFVEEKVVDTVAALAQRVARKQVELSRREHDAPDHPVVAAAKQRIEELTRRHAAVEGAHEDVHIKRPTCTHPDEIVGCWTP